MRGEMKATGCVVLLMLVLLLDRGTQCWAQEEAGVPFLQEPIQTPIHKMGRGVAGFLTAWVEVPKRIATGYKAGSGLHRFGDAFEGMMDGCLAMSKRALIGCYETVTFALPFPRYYRSSYEALGMSDSAYTKNDAVVSSAR